MALECRRTVNHVVLRQLGLMPLQLVRLLRLVLLLLQLVLLQLGLRLLLLQLVLPLPPARHGANHAGSRRGRVDMRGAEASGRALLVSFAWGPVAV